MSCLKLVLPSLPSLPAFSIPDLATPGFTLGASVDFCCTYAYDLSVPPIPIPLSLLGGSVAVAVGVLTTMVAALDVIHDELQAYVDKLQIPKCPFED